MTVEDIKRLVAPLQRRIMNMVSRAKIKLADDDTAQIVALEDEVRDRLDRVQEVGFASVPEEDDDAVVIYVGGNRDHGVVIATRSANRPELEPGETAIYTKDVVVRIKANKEIHITGAEKLVISCDVEVDGNITATGEVEANGKQLSTHTHPAGTLLTGPTPGSPVTGSTGGPS